MAVTSQQVRTGAYACNGIQTVFTVPWMFHYDEALLVVLRLLSDGSETVQTLTTHYTVSGRDVPSGGQVTMLVPPSSLYTLTIIHNPALLQRVVLVSGAAVPIVSVERQMDDEVHQNQRTRDLVARGIYLADTDTDGTGAFDARGNRIKNLGEPVAGSDAATKAYVATQTIVSVVPGPGTLTNAMWDATDLLALTNGKGLTAAEMAVETDPFNAGAGPISPSTNARDAWERLQFQLLAILNWLDAGARTHAYQAVPASNLTAVVAAQIAAALGGAAVGTNLLTNGSLMVAQREPSDSASGSIATGLDEFKVDRWYILPTGATVAWARITLNTPTGTKSTHGLQLTGNVGMTALRFGTRLSAGQCRALGIGSGTAKNFTFGAKFRNSGSVGTITPTLTIRSTSLSNDGLQSKYDNAAMTIRYGPTAMGAAIALGASASYTATMDLGTQTQNANGIEIYVDFGAIINTSQVRVSDLWLAVADISTTLLPDDFYAELEKCKRHYQKTFDYATRPEQSAGLAGALVVTGGNEDVAFQWDHAPPLMRHGALAQLTTYDVQAADNQATNGADYVTPPGAAPRHNRTVIIITPTGLKDSDWYLHAAVDAEWYD